MNADMIKFLAEAEFEIHLLNLEIYLHGEYACGSELISDYNGDGSFCIELCDVERFESYVNSNNLKINPKYPEIISILIFEK